VVIRQRAGYTSREEELVKFRTLFLRLFAVLLLALGGCSPSADQDAFSSGEVDLETPDVSVELELPAEAMSLARIVRTLEQKGYGPVAEIEMEDNWWEVDAFRDSQRVRLMVDFETGAIMSDTPPSPGKPLSEILESLEEQGYGPVLDVDLKGGELEIETHKEGMVVVLTVDANTGGIVEDE
jgi:uncharacterized membrane protein YkoI